MGSRIGPFAAGLVATVLAWEIIGRTHAFGSAFAPLSAVLAYALVPQHRAVLGDALLRTGGEAFAGLACGACAGIALAALGAAVPRLARGLGAFASVVNGIPIIAVAGVCVLALPRDATPVVVSSLAAGFIVFVATSAGLASAAPGGRDVFAVLGATRAATFRRLLLPYALPSVLDGLRSAAPSAVVGAIVGEWFAAERGLGPLLVAAMQNAAIDQLWAAALCGALLSIAAYAALGALRRAVELRCT